MSTIIPFKKQNNIICEDKDRLRHLIQQLIDISHISSSNTIQITVLDDRIVLESKNYCECKDNKFIKQDSIVRILQLWLLDNKQNIRSVEDITEDLYNGLKQIKHDDPM